LMVALVLHKVMVTPNPLETPSSKVSVAEPMA